MNKMKVWIELKVSQEAFNRLFKVLGAYQKYALLTSNFYYKSLITSRNKIGDDSDSNNPKP